MKGIALALLSLCTVACVGSSTTPRPASEKAGANRAAQLERLRHGAERRDQRIRELEGQLALAQAEVRDVRRERETLLAERRRNVVRIGPHRSDDVTNDDFEPYEPHSSNERRPVLRLYGTRTATPMSSAPSGPFVVPSPPAGVDARLPVVPFPSGSRASLPGASFAAAQPSSGPDPVVEKYRAALGLVQQRKYGDALVALTRFTADHPRHAYADNALYWVGEVQYALRQYARARAAFEHLVSTFPNGNKTPDAMFKLGLCFVRLGEPARARAVFRRVREQYPQSVAARLASREDAS